MIIPFLYVPVYWECHLDCVNAKKVSFGRLPFSGRNNSWTGQEITVNSKSFIVQYMLTNNFVLIEIVVSLELGEIINIYTMYGTKPTKKNEWY